MSKTPILYIVGQRPDNSFVTAEISDVPDGDGIDTAGEWCRDRGLKYVTCARSRPISAAMGAA